MKSLYALLAVAALTTPAQAVEGPCGKPSTDPAFASVVDGEWVLAQTVCGQPKSIPADAGVIKEDTAFAMLVVKQGFSEQKGRHDDGTTYSNGSNTKVVYNKKGFHRCIPTSVAEFTYVKLDGKTEMLIENTGKCEQDVKKTSYIVYVRAKKS